MIEVVDALDRHVQLKRPASRVVSLVPSETASVVDLAGAGCLVGRTDYCTEPLGKVETIPVVSADRFRLAGTRKLSAYG